MLKHIMFASALGLAGLGLVACSATPTQESTGQYLDNSVTTAKVKTALLNDKDINSTSITVKTFKGTVQLSGFVDTQTQIDAAGKVAAGVEGVQHVENNLLIK